MGMGTLGLIVPLILVAAIVWGIVTVMKAQPSAANQTPERPGGNLDAARQIELLARENGELKGQVSRLEERIAVLERIATDPAERTAREIDDLR